MTTDFRRTIMAKPKPNASSKPNPKFTVPGLETKEARIIAEQLQGRLIALIDLSLTLKHIHWNVVGPTFIGVHTMLDPQVDGVAAMVDQTAERIATLGTSPNGLPGNLVQHRSWDDYELGRALVPEHLSALDLVFNGVVEDHRRALDVVADLDPITEDMLIQQTASLEMYQWFVRAHLESSSGRLINDGAKTETAAAGLARRTGPQNNRKAAAKGKS
jgi:starvation-inducible DNA-binding protein